MASDCFELFVGGVAGPGKTWFLTLDAAGLQFASTALAKAAVHVPGYRAILFRRKTTELGKILDEAHRYYPLLGGRYSGGRKGDPGPSYRFPPDGIIYFSHMNNEKDKENHQTFEYQYAGFDEVTQFSITQYLYIFSRVRSKIPGLFARVRSAANPIGPGLVWTRKRFIYSQPPHQRGYFRGDADPLVNPAGIPSTANDPHALSRMFIPGVYEENRYRDPQYHARILAMGTTMFKALAKGDWEAFGGDFFASFNRSMCIPPFLIPNQWRLYGSVDPGWFSPCSFSMHAVDFHGNHYRIVTYYEREKNPRQHAKAIKALIQNCKYTGSRMPDLIVSGKDAWAEKDKYTTTAPGKTFAEEFQAEGLYLQPANTDRIQGWGVIRTLMDSKQWFCFNVGNEAFLEELVSVTRDPHHLEDILGCGNDPEVPDHALDEERYSDMASYTPAPPPPQRTWAQVLADQAKEKKEWKPGMG